MAADASFRVAPVVQGFVTRARLGEPAQRVACRQWRKSTAGFTGCGKTPDEGALLKQRLSQRFQSCYTPEPPSLSGFFLKKKPPRTILEYGYMNSGTALR